MSQWSIKIIINIVTVKIGHCFQNAMNNTRIIKEVCNGGVACSLLKLGSLEKTVTASLFHSGLHSSSPFFCRKNHTTQPFAFVGDSSFFLHEKD